MGKGFQVSAAAILDLPILENGDFPGWTIRRYFQELLKALWREGEGFSGKRPLGNSGWDWDILPTLIHYGVVDGSLDLDGQPTGAPGNYHQVVEGLIDAL